MESLNEKICKELWVEYEPSLRRICAVKMRSIPSDIDDVISDTFLSLCKKVNQSGVPDNPKAWLYATLNNIINAKYREMYVNRERIIPLSDNEYELPYENSFEDEIMYQILIDEIREELEAILTPDEKQLINMIFYNKMTYKKIAEVLGTTENSIKQRKYRLFRKVQDHASKKFLK